MLDFSSGGPPPREPLLFIPAAVVVVIAALLLIHAALEFAPLRVQASAYLDLGFIPGRLTVALWPGRLDALIARSAADPHALDMLRLWRATTELDPGAKPWTLVTYAFLHTSWTHVGLNCAWLGVFGPPLARRCGALRFFGFFLATAVCGAALEWAATPMDFVPSIGASASVSGFMAGAVRFMFQDGGPLGGRPLARARTLSLYEALSDRRALIFVGVWFVTNLVFGIGAQALGLSDVPVGWIAHIGGFVGGLALFPLFDARRAWRVGREN